MHTLLRQHQHRLTAALRQVVLWQNRSVHVQVAVATAVALPAVVLALASAAHPMHSAPLLPTAVTTDKKRSDQVALPMAWARKRSGRWCANRRVSPRSDVVANGRASLSDKVYIFNCVDRMSDVSAQQAQRIIKRQMPSFS
jgi:hypothetical protein